MRSPLDDGRLLELHETPSTQKIAVEHLALGSSEPVGIVFAHYQSAGAGRFDRGWYSERDNSLTASLIFRGYADHPMPWLVGMAVALAVAGATHTRVSWPNDLQLRGKKVGGILTTLAMDAAGRRVPVVGVGINLHVAQFPAEIADRAANIDADDLVRHQPRDVLDHILRRISLLPEPDSWASLRSIWAMFDETPGKRFQLATGETAVGIGLGPQGELICAVDGETRSVLAAEALFGQ